MDNSTIAGFIEIDGEIRLSHREFSDWVGRRQDNIRDLIEKYLECIEAIGPCPMRRVRVPVGFGGFRKTKVYYLDVHQANFMIGMLRNRHDSLPLKTDVIIEYKKAQSILTPVKKPSYDEVSEAMGILARHFGFTLS